LRIQLTNLVSAAFLASIVKGALGHAGFNQTGTDGVDTNIGSSVLVSTGLTEVDDSCLGGRVFG
jgi:hypothetical protein